MREHERRFVALFDILGFSQLATTASLTDLVFSVQRLLGVTTLVSHSFSAFVALMDQELDQLATIVFSDTIFVGSAQVTGKNDDADVVATTTFFKAVTEMLGVSILTECLPLRGGIAYGPTFIRPAVQMFLGAPVVWAYRTERQQNWLGAACHPSCLEADVFRRHIAKSDYVQLYDVPTHEGHQELYALNWYGALKNMFPADGLWWEGVNNFLAMGAHVGPADVRKKYDATYRFYRHLRDRSTWSA